MPTEGHNQFERSPSSQWMNCATSRSEDFLQETLPLEKSKPRVDPPVEPIGDGYCLDPEKTPKRMIGTDQQISGEKGRSPEKRLAPRWEVGALNSVAQISSYFKDYKCEGVQYIRVFRNYFSLYFVWLCSTRKK